MNREKEPQTSIPKTTSNRGRVARRVGKAGLLLGGPALAIAAGIFGGSSKDATATEGTPTPVRENTPTVTFHTATPAPSETSIPTQTSLPTREATPTSVPHTATPVSSETPVITPTRESTPTTVPHTPTTSPTREATPTTVPHTPTTTTTPENTPTVTSTPRPGETPSATATKTATATATPKPEIKIREIPTGFTRGETMRVVSNLESPKLAKESDIASIDILRDGVPLFGAQVTEAAPVVSNIEWSGRVVRTNVETYAIPEALDTVGQIDTGDPDKLLVSGHSSLFGRGEPVFSRLDEVKTGDVVSVFKNGEAVPYKVVYSGMVGSVEAEINKHRSNPVLFMVTCPEGIDPNTTSARLMVIAETERPVRVSEPIVTLDVPVIGEVKVTKGMAAGTLLTIAGAAAGAMALGAAKRKREALDTHVNPLN